MEAHVQQENQHDIAGIMATFGAQARYDDEPWNEHHEGRDAVQAYYQTLLAASADFQIEVRRRHVSEASVILEVIISGTHTGWWRGLPGTGRHLEFPLCGIYSFDPEDKLAGEKIYYDRATVLRQLGLFHEPETWIGKVLTPLSHPLTMGRALGRTLLSR